MGSSEDFKDLDHQTDFDCSRQTLCCQLENEAAFLKDVLLFLLNNM